MSWILKDMKIEYEYNKTFHAERNWQIDFRLTGTNIAIEVEGGTWKKSRHGYGLGFERDCVKYNEVVLAGFCLLRFTTNQIKTNPKMVEDFIRRALCQK